MLAKIRVSTESAAAARNLGGGDGFGVYRLELLRDIQGGKRGGRGDLGEQHQQLHPHRAQTPEFERGASGANIISSENLI